MPRWLRLPIGANIVAAGLALFLLWQVAAWLVNSTILPGPGGVLLAFPSELRRGLMGHVAISAYRVGVSILLAGAVAAPLGMVLGLNRTLYAFTAPLVYVSYPIPKIVFLPLLLLFFGLGDMPKIAMIFLILFFQVLLLVRDAAQNVRAELVFSVRSLGAHGWQLLRYVYFPASLPALLSALRVSTGTAIAVLFFVESFGTSSGLGYYILVESWGRLDYTRMYVGVLSMALLGLATYYLLDFLESRLCRWTRVGG